MTKELHVNQASVSKKEVKILQERISALSLPKSRAKSCKWLMFTVFALLFFFIFFYTVTALCSYPDIFELSELVQYIIFFGILCALAFVICCFSWTISAVPRIDKKCIAAKQNQQNLLQSAQTLTDLIDLQENLKCTFASNKDWQACVTVDHVYLFESKGSVLAVLKEFELPSGVFNVEDPYSLDFSIIDSMYQELSVKVASWNK